MQVSGFGPLFVSIFCLSGLGDIGVDILRSKTYFATARHYFAHRLLMVRTFVSLNSLWLAVVAADVLKVSTRLVHDLGVGLAFIGIRVTVPVIVVELRVKLTVSLSDHH